MKYTEGVCGDGSAILCNGQHISITQILSQLNFIDRLLEQNDSYEVALVACKNKFECYEQHHLAKGDAEKAAKNAEMVEMIRNALVGK